MLEGSLALTLSGQRHLLRRREAAGIPAGCGYKLENPGKGEARLAIVIRR